MRGLRAIGILIGLSLAACSGRGAGAPTQTPSVIVAGTAPLATAAPATDTAGPATLAPQASATAGPATEAAPTASAAPRESTAVPGGSALPDTGGALSDPWLETYRVMVSMQINAVLLSETAALVEAGELNREDTAVAALALVALAQSVEEAVPGVRPPPALAGPWQSAVAAHTAIQSAAGQWLLGGQEASGLAKALAPHAAELEAALAQADSAVAEEYGVEAARLTEYRMRIARTVARLYED